MYISRLQGTCAAKSRRGSARSQSRSFAARIAVELFDAIFRDRRAYSLWSPRRRLESFLVQILYRSLDDLVFSEAARGRESCDQ